MKTLSLLNKSERMMLIISLFLFQVCATSLFAQNSVRGSVSDSKGESLIGVNVMVKGTNHGTVSDVNGEFTLNVENRNATLEFSYVGFKTQEVALQGKTVLSIVMIEDTELLDEIVVVGYGVQKKTSVTGAVSVLADTELIKAPVIGVTNVLGARVAGVTMLQQSGQPGQDAASLLVRGEGATYIVDGVKRSINEIDPNEIESISITINRQNLLFANPSL